ncbi:hypothetical protein LRY65_01685 [Candidatus Woesebacteria bacterium]|nr:hypothetical protein [Candidatus Woesebacteria bacterium]
MHRALSGLKKIGFFEGSLLILLVLIWILLSNHLWHGDILFHTDLARDFLVLDEMVTTQNPTLIGPRSGGIPGVFHGPLWYYLSLVPFIATGGNPVGMGWFWWTLGVFGAIVFLLTTYRLTKNVPASLLGTIAFSLYILPQAASPVNNYLADIFSFLVFAVWVLWWQETDIRWAALGWFGLGLLVQFQMAFAVPIAVIWFPAFVFWLVKQKKYRQFSTAFLFGLPLLSFVLFDVRHDWLQVRSVLTYISEPSASEISLPMRLWQRLVSALTDGLNVFRFPPILAVLPVVTLGALGWMSKNTLIRTALLMFAWWYAGWWLMALGFSGTVWVYYFSPFAGIVFLVSALIANHSKWGTYGLAGLVFWMLLASRSNFFYSPKQFDGSSWSLLSHIADEALAKPGRGYFVYSQDQFAYSLKYAFAYSAKSHSATDVFAFQKRPETVLVKAPDDPRNPYATSQDWQENKLSIQEEPDSVQEFPFGYRMELYSLDAATIAKPIDPNLILDLHFR